jgi:acetyl esterase/lipase
MKTKFVGALFLIPFLASVVTVEQVAAQQPAVIPAAPKPIGRGEPPPATQPRLLLWPNGAPLAMGTEEKDTPWLWLYPAPPETANGSAVVICPGGGYGGLATAHEGNEVAKFFNSLGVHAFVLKYRLSPYRHPVPMLDVQRALRLVRANAADWKVNPERVGVMGFSAGGHLASTAATHFDEGQTTAEDPVDRLSCRPDFAVLCYPVISFTTEYVHAGSRKNLLGENPDPELVQSLSNELQVTERTPPTFLFHTGEDKGVPPENSVLFYMALRKAKVPAEMHLYERGPHGVGLVLNDPILGTWSARLAGWLKTRGLIPQ